MTDGSDLISLLSFTLGSVGQVVKDVSTLKDHSTKEQKFDEIKRIYDGYIQAIKRRELSKYP